MKRKMSFNSDENHILIYPSRSKIVEKKSMSKELEDRLLIYAKRVRDFSQKVKQNVAIDQVQQLSWGQLY